MGVAWNEPPRCRDPASLVRPHFISALVTEGSITFIRDREYILGSNFSIDIYISRTVFKSFITFSHHFVLYFIGTALGLVHFGWTSLLAVIGIVLLFLNGYWIVALFALVCTRYRDVEQIVRNLLQLGFFVTPVFWDYRVVASNRAFVVDYNFLFYMLEIVRAPLLGEVPAASHYAVVLATTVVGFFLAYLAYRRMRRRLAFFV